MKFGYALCIVCPAYLFTRQWLQSRLLGGNVDVLVEKERLHAPGEWLWVSATIGRGEGSRQCLSQSDTTAVCLLFDFKS